MLLRQGHRVGITSRSHRAIQKFLEDADDGYRVLIDRLWPRGLSKAHACVNAWARPLAPSDDLRRWFAHQPERFDEFLNSPRLPRKARRRPLPREDGD